MSLRARYFKKPLGEKILYKISSRALWNSLVFTMVAGLAACSSKKNNSDEMSASDTSTVDTSGNSASLDSDGFSMAPVNNEAAQETWSGSSRAPQIKEQPFQVDGRWMNSFYFVRSPDETWESLSEMIYGRPDRANFISKWNNDGTLKVGRVVYYNSAIRPDDSSSMKVFAEDFGSQLEQISVEKGDTLSLIAQKRYGNLASWKEIAALNNLNNPDLIQVGQVLAVQPVQVNTKEALAQVIAQSSQNSDSNAPNTTASVTDSNSAQAPPSDGTDNADAELADLDPSQVPDSVVASTTKKFANSDLFMNIGFGIIVLALVAFLVRKRIMARKAASETASSQVWEDQANVTKLTRPKTGF